MSPKTAAPLGATPGAFPTAVALGLAALSAACGSSSDPANPVVISPSNGTVWGGERTIRWQNFSTEGGIVLDLSTDGGATYPTSISAGTSNNGTFSFDTSGEADGANFRVRVVGGDERARSGVFSIDNTDPTIALTAPVGGELFGGDSTITWTTTDVNPGTVNILASADGGANYDIVVAAAAPDSGTFAWDASSLTDAATYRVQVIATDAAGNESVADASGGDFEIDRTAPVVTVTSPNGGETLTGTQNITWTTVDANPSTVTIMLSDDGGATYGETIATDVADTGTFAWQSGRVDDGTDFRVQVVATDLAGNESAADRSDASFSAQNLRLESPCHYLDANANGLVDQGDQLYLRFDDQVTVSMSATAADFVMPKAGDSLGAGALVVAGTENDTVLITLGAGPVFRTRGTFDEANLADPKAPSGITLADPITADAIESAIDGVDAAPIAPAEIAIQPFPGAPLPGSANESRRGAVGDLDGDGDLDLVIAVIDGDPSERWAGDGAGGWTLVQSFGTDNTRDVALGDIDGDGDLDLVTAVSGPNLVWTNDGSGALTDSAQSLGSGSSQAVELFDADGDGDLDAVFANSGNQANTVWLNDGSGAFANTGQTLGGRSTLALTSADFDGDGDLDFFAANDNQDSRMWLNNGSGVFSGGVSTLSTNARDVESADLDRDGDIDVFMSVLGQNQVLLNDGDAEFPDGPVFYGNNDNRGLKLFDIDHDGDLDSITAKNLDSGRYWINDGAGDFFEDTVDTLADDAVDVVVGRFDADDDVDFLVINRLGAHRPYSGSASGGQTGAEFESAAQTASLWQSGAGASGDIDGDGDPDLIVPDVVGVTNILLNDGAGTLIFNSTFGGADARGGDLFDADGDGDLDYLQRIGDAGASTDRLWTNSNGSFTDSGLMLGLDTYAAGDVDGDGDADLVVFDGTNMEPWLGDGAGGFTASGVTVAATGSIAEITDLDGDGDMDVVTADATDILVLENDGLGTFTAGPTFSFASGSAIATGDLDRDGDLDILVAGSGGATNLTWFSNSGSLTFAAAQTALATTNAISQIELFDRNEDGDLDLFAIDSATGNRFENLGLGNGTFAAGGPTSVVDLSSATVFDIDRDGDLDAYLSLGDDATPSAVLDQVLSYN